MKTKCFKSLTQSARQILFAASLAAAFSGCQSIVGESSTTTGLTDSSSNSASSKNISPTASPSPTATAIVTFSISAPSATTANAGDTITYSVTYSIDAADEALLSQITLTTANITLEASPGVSCTIGLSGSGLTSRLITLSQCKGNGTADISITTRSILKTGKLLLGASGSSGSIIVNNLPPTVNVGAPSVMIANSAATINFPVSYNNTSKVDLTPSGVTVNASADVSCNVGVANGTTSSPTVSLSNCLGSSPTATISISIAAGTAADSSGNPNTASPASSSFNIDNQVPQVAISLPTSSLVTSGGSTNFQLTYTPGGTYNLTPAGVTLNKTGTATCTVGVTGGTTASPTVSLSNCTGVGSVGISIAAGTALSDSGTPSAASSASALASVDTVAPVAQPQLAGLTVVDTSTLPITLVGTDAAGLTLTYAISTAPAHGTLSGTLPNVVYHPTAPYQGTDFFYFVAKDSNVTSNAAKVNVAVTHVAPTASSQSVTVSYNTAKAITVTGTGGGTLSYTIVTQPTHGSISGTGPNYTYTPNTGYSGSDLFTYEVSDPISVSAPAPITLQVNPAAPVANALSTNVNYNTATSIALTGTGSGNLSYAIITNPTHGTVSGSAPNVTYTPNNAYSGADYFTFQITDSLAQTSNIATVSITVSAQVLAPAITINPLSGQAYPMGASVSISGTCSPNGQTVTLAGVDNVATHGSRTTTCNTSASPNWSLAVPSGSAPWVAGTLSLTATISNGQGSQASATSSIYQHASLVGVTTCPALATTSAFASVGASNIPTATTFDTNTVATDPLIHLSSNSGSFDIESLRHSVALSSDRKYAVITRNYVSSKWGSCSPGVNITQAIKNWSTHKDGNGRYEHTYSKNMEGCDAIILNADFVGLCAHVGGSITVDQIGFNIRELNRRRNSSFTQKTTDPSNTRLLYLAP